MRCQACRRPLTNPISQRHGLGPDCLRRAVKAGTAPLEALTEMVAFQRSTAKSKAIRTKPAPVNCSETLDLFGALKDAALDDLNNAVNACRNIGIEATVTIGE